MAMDVRENQARIAEVVKLKTAAVLQLRENLSPADALKRADLPADVQNSSLWSGKLRKMRGHLKQHLDDWVADDWGGRASPSPTSAGSATSSPLSTPRESAAAPTPKVFLTIPQNEEMKEKVKELERKVAELEAEKKLAVEAARKKVERRDKKKLELEAALAKERQEHSHTRTEAAHYNNEVEMAKEALEEWITNNEDNPEVQNCTAISGELRSWEGGRYSDSIRLIYMQLIRDGVSPNNIRNSVCTILQLAGVTVDRLPGRATAQYMKAEMAALADQEAGATLMEQPNGSVAMAGDEATKLGKSRFALGMFFANSIGDPIVFAALGVVDAMGGTADMTREAIVDLLERIAANHTLVKR
eukprot:COSAG06_NODE_150_length_22019_cov_17.221031_2_plen_359_part_00